MGEMEIRRLGNSGLAVSVVGLGCNNFGGRIDPERSATVIHTALDVGINLFDTADIYGGGGRSEEILGSTLKAAGRRDDVLIATKFGADMSGTNGQDWGARGARRYVHRAVEASLRRLQTDWIDLYQIHAPDPVTPIAETLSALDDLVRAGKVRYLGNSNFRGWQVADAAWTALAEHLTPFVSAQNEYSLIKREVEVEVIPACHRFGLGMLPYFPLGSGLLSGKYHRGAPPPDGARLSSPVQAPRLANAPWDVIEALEKYAAERGRSLLDVAIGGLAAQPTVASVIAGATRPEQVVANVAAGAWRPSPDDLAALDTIARPRH